MTWLTDLGATIWLPHLSPEMQAVVRLLYAAVLLGTIAHALPHVRRFFLSERWGGYGEASAPVRAIQNPTVMPAVLAAWAIAALLLAAGILTPWTALATVLISRYFFIQMRWRSVLRGMGAPGFVVYWLGAAVFVLELTRTYAPAIQPLALVALQVDLGCIMLIAGTYKLTAGYARNEGMELGLANPQWGYWWRRYSRVTPTHLGLRLLNHLAWSTEIAIGLLTFLPRGRAWAGALLFTTFAFIATQIRLSLLCPTMMAAALIYIPAGSAVDRAISSVLPLALVAAPTVSPLPSNLGTAITIGLLAYLALLPLAYGGLVFNFYARRRLPASLQRLLETYTNAFGMILWRVFSADVTNFYVVIHEAYRDGRSPAHLVSAYPGVSGAASVSSRIRRRFAHVAESIAITSIFTSLKYYPDDRRRFEERLLRYARTIRCRSAKVLVFDYISLQKGRDAFCHVPTTRFVVDLTHQTVVEHPIVDAFDVTAAASRSPVFAGARPGSYAPLAS